MFQETNYNAECIIRTTNHMRQILEQTEIKQFHRKRQLVDEDKSTINAEFHVTILCVWWSLWGILQGINLYRVHKPQKS